MNEDVLIYCGAVAFKVLVTILPLSLLVIGIFGLFLREASVLQGLADLVEAALPAGQADAIIEVLQAFAGASDTITLIGGIALIVAGISLFTTLRQVLEYVFHKTHIKRSTIQGYLKDLEMAIICGALFFATLALTNVRQFDVDIAALPNWMQEGWASIEGWSGLVIPFLLSSFLFFLLYFLMPRPRPSARSALVGATFAGLGWEAAKHGFTILATHSAMFSRLRNVEQQVELNTLGELFILAVVLVFWVYYSSVVLVVGGMITQLR